MNTYLEGWGAARSKPKPTGPRALSSTGTTQWRDGKELTLLPRTQCPASKCGWPGRAQAAELVGWPGLCRCVGMFPHLHLKNWAI